MPNAPGKGGGFLEWLGRQVGHVAKAVKTDVTAGQENAGPTIVYRNDKIEEAPHPTDPNLKLRRTVIDEVVEKGKGEGT